MFRKPQKLELSSPNMKMPESAKSTYLFSLQLFGVLEDYFFESAEQLETAPVVFLEQLEDSLDVVALDLATLRAERVFG
jgi:hypothetical protein